MELDEELELELEDREEGELIEWKDLLRGDSLAEL